MKSFVLRWALASAGFLALELATRPHRRPPAGEELTDRAAAALVDLVLLDVELRGDLDNAGRTPEVRVPPRSLCLSSCCHGAG